MSSSANPSTVPESRTRLHDFCRPGVIVHLLFPNARRERGLTEHLVNHAADSDFYRAVEIAEVEDTTERRAIRGIAQRHDLWVVYWLSFLQMEGDASISSPDEMERKRAVASLARQLAFAAECGADAVGIVSGRDVGERERPRALASLKKSILELAEAGRAHGLNRFEMETMDREAHKKHVLGPTEEAITFIESIRASGVDFHLVFDTAHIRLLGENVEDSIVRAASVTGHIHLANCVADPAHPKFGDNHMPLGAPGFLGANTIGKFLERARRVGALGAHRPVVSVEVGADGGERAWRLEEQSRRTMMDFSHSRGK